MDTIDRATTSQVRPPGSTKSQRRHLTQPGDADTGGRVGHLGSREPKATANKQQVSDTSQETSIIITTNAGNRGSSSSLTEEEEGEVDSSRNQQKTGDQQSGQGKTNPDKCHRNT